MNTNKISKNYNKIRRNKIYNIQIFEKYNYIRLRNNKGSHKNMHMACKNLKTSYAFRFVFTLFWK